MRKKFNTSAVYASTALSLGLVGPVIAAESTLEEIVVTARRVEERLQDVPISMTVFSQQQLTDRNVATASDLAAFTPSLSVDKRFGPDQSSFAIRGFTQDIRTTASVAVYFADTVALRGGSTGTTAGDGAGPGAFFDLQNVQVLKGPQGTLFGRNTTGGAVLLVPQKPTREFEGYVEGSYGNYDMKRGQAVVNLPINDSVRLRVGFDGQKRDGYLKNISGKGPSDFADINYYAGRVGLVVDITPNLENYTLGTYSKSDTNGFLQQVFACAPAGGFSSFCRPQVARLQGQDHFAVESAFNNPQSLTEQWQAINTTTWLATDELTVKNIASYGQLRNIFRQDIYGANFSSGTTPWYYITTNPPAGLNTNDQWTLTEELQFQGRLGNDRLLWQAGGYFERSGPNDPSGTFGPSFISCSSFDPITCTHPFGSNVGSVGYATTTIKFRDVAAYAQGTYSLTDQLKLTTGVRYTSDKTEGTSESGFLRFLNPATPSVSTLYCQNPDTGTFTGPGNTPAPVADLSACHLAFKQSSSKPTWTVDLEYKPIDDLMLYGKYSRGYRQGVVNPLGPSGFTQSDPEKVDTYEAGVKTTFRAVVPGTFNVAAFYNDFTNQQLLIGVVGAGGIPSGGAIVNAGKSRIYGAEVEASLLPFEGFKFDLGYTYLNTLLQDFTVPTLPPGSPYASVVPTAVAGGPLVFSPSNKLSTTVTYTLPLPDTIGKVSIGATYTYTDKQLVFANSPFGTLPSTNLVNLNLKWAAILGSKIDASLFATNALNEKYTSQVGGQWTRGFESRALGEPRMFGVRVRVPFGGEQK